MRKVCSKAPCREKMPATFYPFVRLTLAYQAGLCSGRRKKKKKKTLLAVEHPQAVSLPLMDGPRWAGEQQFTSGSVV